MTDRQDGKSVTIRTGWGGGARHQGQDSCRQESWDKRTGQGGRAGQRGQDSWNIAAGRGQLGHDSRERKTWASRTGIKISHSTTSPLLTRLPPPFLSGRVFSSAPGVYRQRLSPATTTYREVLRHFAPQLLPSQSALERVIFLVATRIV